MIKRKTSLFLFAVATLLVQCAATYTNSSYFSRLDSFIASGDFESALVNIDQAKESEKYAYKDRLLYFLDKGVLLSYKGEYEQSNQYLNEAETAMEELFTKSISSGAVSLLLNDNALPYYGEVYENIYVNIFKALNFIKLDKFEEAYVEIRRVNVKLRELADKNRQLVENLNTSKDAAIPFKTETIDFYDDVLAHYLSYLIFRAEGEADNSRISLQKMQKAWETHSNIYNYAMPGAVKKDLQALDAGAKKKPSAPQTAKLNLIAFIGRAPQKKAIGGLITTYDNAIGISGLDMPIALPNIPFPNMKAGYHFKFSLPLMESGNSNVQRIEVSLDNNKVGEMELLEDLGQVAVQTFKSKIGIIYTKTLTRTVLKGLAAVEAKQKLREKTKASGIWADLMDAAVDIGVDATENADLRYCRTLPQQCYIGEFEVPVGAHTVNLTFISKQGQVIENQQWDMYEVDQGLNLIDTALLN
jgi:uncharacterized protein